MAAEQRRDSERPLHRATLTGARNDNSSLFSLDLIRRAEAAAGRTAPEPTEESGLIDLRALADLSMSAPSRVDRAPLVVSASAGLFSTTAVSVAPLLAAVPAAAVASELPPNFAASRGKLFVAIGSVVTLIVATFAFVSMGGGNAPQPVSAAAATLAPPPPPLPLAPPVVAEAPPIAAVTPGARATAVEPPKLAAPVAVVALPRKSTGAPAPRAEVKAAAPKEEIKPAAPVCDLTCQMERAVAATK